MTIVCHNSTVRPLLAGDIDLAALDRLEELLADRETFTFHALPNGLFPAAVADETTGYRNVWVRDNVHLGNHFLVTGQADVAAGVVRGLLDFFRTQTSKIDRLVAGTLDADEPMNRPHIRFDGSTLRELPEKWAHAQNDALGYFLWLASESIRGHHVHAHADDVELLLRFVPLLHAISYWEDKDSGHWEEYRKVAASSIGAAVQGLTSLRELLEVHSELPGLTHDARTKGIHEIDDLAARGTKALLEILPWECRSEDPREQRQYDGALLFLIYPLELLPPDGLQAEQILEDVRNHLEGPIGVRRYLGDSYWCADYKDKLSAEIRTADFSDKLSERDALLKPGEEAQWCIFDPILSCIYGLRYRNSKDDGDRRLQEHYLKRSLAQITGEDGEAPAFRCPESYYLQAGNWVPNDVTPLLWTQANLRLALHEMRATLQSSHAQ